MSVGWRKNGFFVFLQMQEATLKFPDYYPLKVRKCQMVADPFFYCLENQNNDLTKCQETMKQYQDCMGAYFKYKY